MKQTLVISISIAVILLLGIIGTLFFVQFWPGLKPAVLPPVSEQPLIPVSPTSSVAVQIPEGYYQVGDYTIPNGFTFSVLTDQVPGARDIILAPNALIVSQTGRGTVSSIDPVTGSATMLLRGLRQPHGLALALDDPNLLYIAEEHRIVRVRLDDPEKQLEPVVSLPGGGRHVTRTIRFGTDGALYVSIGSTCDACEESNPLHGTIQRLNLETNQLEPYATGLRNAVFFTWHELDGSMWAAEMGRDFLGDHLPPDELNRIEAGGWYGWPWYYGNNIFDKQFAGNRMPNFAYEAIPATIELPAHVAPLGIDTIPEEGWPEDYWYDVVIAYHGSFNRSVPVGYSVVRHRFGSDMTYLGAADLVQGWLTPNNRAIGRPAGLLAVPGGTLYITDDAGGRVYQLQYTGIDMRTPDTADVALPYITEVETNTLTQTTTQLTGEALGTWYFEASFPIEVIDDGTNQVLETLIATATTDWMTTSSVPFTTPFDASLYSGQTIRFVLIKDNPSGLPEFDDSVTTDVVLIP